MHSHDSILDYIFCGAQICLEAGVVQVGAVAFVIAAGLSIVSPLMDKSEEHQ